MHGLVLALSMAACTTAPPVELPIGEEIPVWIDGRGPFGFGFDSGQSPAVILTPELAREIELRQVGQASVGDGSGQGERLVPLLRVETLALEGAELHDLDALVLEGAQRGTLGFSCFADGLLTLDHAHGRALWHRGALPEPDGRSILPLDLGAGASPSLPVTIAGKPYLALVDSGWDTGFMLPAALEGELALDGPARVVGRVATLFNEFEIREARLAGEITIGERRFEQPTVQFNPVLDHVLVGTRFLDHFEVTFDQRNARVRLVATQAL